ncbi:hypothetical protein [Legionella feeleii]|uniref:Uncharacterized protein n=1 Tax=Legionella feeleii TaxID=453 RepID=A0A0W0U6M0_9GAMM|nr:hypothetical protein [Legionella feeleii]KTD03161.1 hypothetical protein Lfee_0517 [Legionella feeleii]SPX59773.1 Uncharacterised protein [Legionella feeleii]STX38386.1 Uncharacterised protein [Legionella feeleii]
MKKQDTPKKEKQYQIKKNEQYQKREIRLNTFSGFFAPFTSLSDMQQETRSTLLIPIVNLTMAVGSAVFSIGKLAETAANLAILDLNHAAESNNMFLAGIETSCCFVGSLLFDTLWSLVSLALRTVSTLVAGVAATAKGVIRGGEAVINCCTCQPSL